MSLYVGDSATGGRGVFTTQRIARGSPVLPFKGPAIERAQLDPNQYHLQIGEALYLGPSGEFDDYVNHSCEPNCGINDELVLVALRDIEAGEELTWDYGTAIDEDDFDGFPCRCRARACRGRVISYRHLPPDVQRRLSPWLLPYLKSKYC